MILLVAAGVIGTLEANDDEDSVDISLFVAWIKGFIICCLFCSKKELVIWTWLELFWLIWLNEFKYWKISQIINIY